MTLTAVQKMRDLDPPARAWLVRVFGPDSAAFSDDAEVRLELRSPADPPLPATEAAPALTAIMARMEDRLREIPGPELEAAVDEAMTAVRPAYRP